MVDSRRSLQDPVRYLKGVGPKRALLFGELGVTCVGDLLNYFPYRLEDYSSLVKMGDLSPGQDVTVRGRVVQTGFVSSQRGNAFRVALSDGTGVVYLVWYNMPYLHRNFPKGKVVAASGRVEWRRNSMEIAHPLVSGSAEENGVLVPVYHGCGGLSSAKIRAVIKEAITLYEPVIQNLLPTEILDRYKLLPEREAYREIHLPSSASNWENARRTFAFRELLFMQLAFLMMKNRVGENAVGIRVTDFSKADKFLAELPFELTQAQQRCIEDIKNDLLSGRPMNRLLQGDVGSGKTVVALYALIALASNGHQGAFMAPTEILASQHFMTCQKYAGNFAKFGYLSSKCTAEQKRSVLKSIAEGFVDIVVGTHALLERDVKWRNLGIAVTDEQHRFGVKQRLALSESGPGAHLLVMSATPIPRSLALTLYGDLDVSVIDQRLPGRKPVQTVVLPSGQRAMAYARVRSELIAGRQAYVVCPAIREGQTDRKAAESVYQEVSNGFLSGFKIGLIHGDMAHDDIDEQMFKFINHQLDVLVSTTIIEVGVDVPNATCMIVEDADRFGLATLHQLRGRVGRGEGVSYCFYISSDPANVHPRLKILESVQDGFEIARMDLLERGPGEFFGLKQHGLSEVKISELGFTLELVNNAREEAEMILEDSRHGENSILIQHVLSRFGNLLVNARSR